MEFDYKKLLEKGRKELPESVFKTERFEIPKVKGHIQGNKTVITNFNQIVSTMRRDPQHLLKFLLKELATPGIMDGPRLVFSRKLKSELINSKIEKYTNTFVICPECKKPDTKLIREGKVYFLKCMACGAKHPIKA